MSELEKKWWFVLIVVFCSTIATFFLMFAAGYPEPGDYNLAQWIIFGLVLGALRHCISGLGWLIVLLVSPRTIPVSGQSLERS